MHRDPEALQPANAIETSLRIAYIPFEDTGNAYTERMRELLSGFGTVERFAGIRALLREWPHSRRRYDAIVVNWFDNDIVSTKSGRISPRGTLRVFLKTMAMKAFARRMIFVRHNAYPHRTAPGSEDAARRLIDRYESLFDIVATHSAATAPGRRYWPHPLYRAAIAPAAAGAPTLPEDYFLVFGRIAPYKQIEALVAAFPAARTLVVAGAVGDEEYARRLAAMRRDNFRFLPGRVDEAEAQRLVRSARALVIANADRDVVVSGSFFYAISFGCPVYAVTTPFLAWAQERIGSELIALAPDIAQLCAAIARADSRSIPAAARAAVLREFGDTAARRALAAALGVGA